jgi:AraC-like DNA-binding protein
VAGRPAPPARVKHHQQHQRLAAWSSAPASPSSTASSAASTTAPTPPGFADLHSYLAARCQDNASLAQLADELGTTVNVIRRLLDHAGLTPPPRRLSAACQRRRATDQRLAARAAQLGFASLPAYLVDRVTQQAWPLTQVAGELGIDRNTVKDCLDRHGLHCGSHTARS